jgi:hypothetical protein
MGRAVGRSLAAGHWPGRGPSHEAWEQIASSFVQARRLFRNSRWQSGAISTDGQIGRTTAKTKILHALYVAAHATAVALTGCQRDLKGVVGELTPALENAHHGGEPLGAPLGGAHHGGEPH